MTKPVKVIGVIIAVIITVIAVIFTAKKVGELLFPDTSLDEITWVG